MKTLLFTLTLVLLTSGCSYFTFNAAMCESIAQDPHATMPPECKNYKEQEALNASIKPSQKERANELEFHK